MKKIRLNIVWLIIVFVVCAVDASEFWKYHRTLFQHCNFVDISIQDEEDMGLLITTAVKDGIQLITVRNMKIGMPLDWTRLRFMVPKRQFAGKSNLDVSDLVFERFLSPSFNMESVGNGQSIRISFALKDLDALAPNNFGIVAYGSDFSEIKNEQTITILVNLYGKFGLVECMEALAPACLALEGSMLVLPYRGHDHLVSVGDRWTSLVELGNAALQDGSWLIKMEGPQMLQQEMHWNENFIRFEADIILRKPGRYTVTATLNFENKTLAREQRGAVDDLDDVFCGESLPSKTLYVSEFCSTGNVAGDWIWVPDEHSRRPTAFLPEVAGYPLYEYVPNSGCQLRWLSLHNLWYLLEKTGIQEVVFLGDSREQSLLDAMGHTMSVSFAFMQYETHRLWPMGDLGKVAGLSVRTNEAYGNCTDPLQQITKNSLELIDRFGLCKGTTKGILMPSIPMFDVRHARHMNDSHMDHFIGALQRRCPHHEIIMLLMQSVHDSLTFLVHQPVQSRFWAPFQNREVVTHVNDMIVRAARRNKLKICDLFTPTDNRPDATVDGVHFLKTVLGVGTRVALDGRNVSHVLVQLIFNTIFPPMIHEEDHISFE